MLSKLAIETSTGVGEVRNTNIQKLQNIQLLEGVQTLANKLL